jgi:hypothetical protein
MGKIDWHSMKLKGNPFHIIPEKKSGNLIWAGLKKIRGEFDSLIINDLNSPKTNVVLYMSRWGGGKTHTSYYYSDHDHLPQVDFKYTLPLSLIIVTPSDGANAFHEFYTKIIEGIGVSTISETIKSMRLEIEDPKRSLQNIQQACESEDIGKMLWLAGDADEEISYEATELFFSPKPSAGIKRKLRIRRGIESTNDKFTVLSAIFKIISKYDESGKLENPRRIFLWLDEIESLIYYTTRYHKTFSQALRGLIDKTPKNLTLFMNFSFADIETISTLEFIIGNALKDRITKKIFFDKLNIPESLEYVGELLRFFRSGAVSSINMYFPFTKEALEILFKKFEEEVKEPLMPRSINKCCLATITQAFEQKYFPQKDIIDPAFSERMAFIDSPLESF